MREEIIGNARLLLADCRDVLPGLHGIDAVVTDPPYGVRNDEWDNMDDREFARFSMQWLSLLPQICAESLIFGYLDSAVHQLAKMIYPDVRPMIWAKPPGSQMSGASERGWFFGFEAVFHCFDRFLDKNDATQKVGAAIKFSREKAGLTRGAVDILVRGKRTGLCQRWEEAACIPTKQQVAILAANMLLPDDFEEHLKAAYAGKSQVASRSDVLSYRTVADGRHPCEKPVSMLHDLIETTGFRWNAVADPFMGVGSTGVACAALGRSFIGIERDPAYFEIAVRRIEAAHRQADLFVQPPAPKPAVTAELF